MSPMSSSSSSSGGAEGGLLFPDPGLLDMSESGMLETADIARLGAAVVAVVAEVGLLGCGVEESTGVDTGSGIFSSSSS